MKRNTMTLEAAAKHYGSKAAVAELLKVKPQSVQNWGDRIPDEHRPTLCIATEGKLRSGGDVKRWKLEIERLRLAIEFATGAEARERARGSNAKQSATRGATGLGASLSPA